MRIKLVIEYEGAAFHGWQLQDGVPTVQSEITKALETFLREPVSAVHASGRTDAGVHARGQVVAFTCNGTPDLDRLSFSVSSLLRGKLSVISAAAVPETFHPREDAVSKQYSYRILNRSAPATLDRGHVWEMPHKLDFERMHRAAAELAGTHDFASFRGIGCTAKTTVRTIFESELIVQPPYVTYRVVGSGFLQYMVRILAGTLVGIGDGTLGSATIGEIMGARDRSRAGVTAPPHGLTLDWVRYE